MARVIYGFGALLFLSVIFGSSSSARTFHESKASAAREPQLRQVQVVFRLAYFFL